MQNREQRTMYGMHAFRYCNSKKTYLQLRPLKNRRILRKASAKLAQVILKRARGGTQLFLLSPTPNKENFRIGK